MTPRRYRISIDGNQTEIARALRRAGYGVADIRSVGGGVPDLVASKNGVNILLEVKMPGEKLTEAEYKWHKAWSGQVATVYSTADALEVCAAVLEMLDRS